MPAAYTYITLCARNSNPTDTPNVRGRNSAYETKRGAETRFLPICACIFSAGGCEVCALFGGCTRVEVQITLHAPQALPAVFPPDTIQTSLAACKKGQLCPHTARQRRSCACPNALSCLIAACFLPGETQMSPGLEGVSPRDPATRHTLEPGKPGVPSGSVHLYPPPSDMRCASVRRTAWLLPFPVSCTLLSYRCSCPPSLSAMMDHTLMPIKPDWHGGLSLFAVEKSMAPRGDQIPVIEFQSTAPPSRANFREIRAPGVCASPNANKP